MYAGKVAYYYIVKSMNLLRIRREIAQAFYSAGGSKKDFDPELFFPHITIGFIGGDIHYPNVLKNEKTLNRRFNVLIH